eukprot:TRINITY_DN74944_c0_g1_i1.p1 TRINITY_DN74944_c0_g1~~TRINITY_DN74944_c0_g1_i1.p1  ORF type:complete len:229 (+),score=18.11 TRINITY_DN74944_c0_g1_i1:38-688(+)
MPSPIFTAMNKRAPGNRHSSRPLCPSSFGGCALLGCICWAIPAMVCIPLATEKAVPDFHERAPIVKHNCLIASIEFQELHRFVISGKTSSGPVRRKYTFGYRPLLHVRIAGEDALQTVTRYREEQDVLEKEQMPEFAAAFPLNSTIACYQFHEGKLKWDENPPPVSLGTYFFIVLVALTACGAATCFCVLMCLRCNAHRLDESGDFSQDGSEEWAA